MNTNNSMTVITSKPFGALNVDVYQNDKHQYYMTREQIGTALEYSDPRIAIYKIHQRNADRLDPLSSVTKLVTQVGNHTENRETIVYSLRGVMEICRFNTHPGGFMAFETIWNLCTVLCISV